jgi:hypothetical protein
MEEESNVDQNHAENHATIGTWMTAAATVGSLNVPAATTTMLPGITIDVTTSDAIMVDQITEVTIKSVVTTTTARPWTTTDNTSVGTTTTIAITKKPGGVEVDPAKEGIMMTEDRHLVE